MAKTKQNKWLVYGLITVGIIMMVGPRTELQVVSMAPELSNCESQRLDDHNSGWYVTDCVYITQSMVDCSDEDLILPGDAGKYSYITNDDEIPGDMHRYEINTYHCMGQPSVTTPTPPTPGCLTPPANEGQFICVDGYIYQCVNKDWSTSYSGIYTCGHSGETGECKYGNNVVKNFGGSAMCETGTTQDQDCSSSGSHPAADDGEFHCVNDRIYQCDDGTWYSYKDCDDYGSNWECAHSSSYTSTSVGALCKSGGNGACSNECSYGERRCSGSYDYQECGDYDSDNCYEWSQAYTCDSGKTCSDGQCVTLGDCTSGQTQGCTIGSCDGIRTCTNNAWGNCIKNDTSCGVPGGKTCTSECNSFWDKCEEGECKPDIKHIMLVAVGILIIAVLINLLNKG